MADPVLKTITAGAVPTLVASAVTSGQVKIIKEAGPAGKIKYMETYLTAGTAAPTTQANMVAWRDLDLTIDASANIDVYVAVIGVESGLVRVDL